MTAYGVTTFSTVLGFPILDAYDTVTISAIGGIFAPGASLVGSGGNTIQIAGALELGSISLPGGDDVGISASGSFY